MYVQLTFSDFRDAFQAVRPDNFTYEGQKALFDYLTDLEEQTGEEQELDVIALCCDYTEYSDLEELQTDYPDIEDMNELKDHTTVIEFDGGIIIQVF